MIGEKPLIAVYIVTYRRHDMLRRALASVQAQTYRNIVVRIINDDPADRRVQEIIEELSDHRIDMYRPVEKRGATRNFNIVFSDKEADYVSLLEDDNWWEPEFLERQLEVLEDNPEAMIVVGNEWIHCELPNGGWLDTRRTIWPFRNVVEHHYRLEEVCGSAKICNSSMLIRVDKSSDLRTPDSIIVDVTEHFRERVFSPPILLNGDPLVNYAVTLSSARTSNGKQWTETQCVLIGSVFIALASDNSRLELARRLWKDCSDPVSPRAVLLLAASVAIREARALLRTAPMISVMRFVVWLVRHPVCFGQLASVKRRMSRELAFLVDAPLTRKLAGRLETQ